MKKLLGILVLGLLCCNVGFAGSKGKGEVKMSDKSLNHFIDYIQGKVQLEKVTHKQSSSKRKPSTFILSSDGEWSFSFWCPYNRCADSGSKEVIIECERETGVNCGVFAQRRTIYWDNGINTKSRKARFKSKMSYEEIKSELIRLGFYGETKTSQDKQKIIKNTTSKSSDIVDKLKDIKKLYDEGVLTKKEFEKAKEKILN